MITVRDKPSCHSKCHVYQTNDLPSEYSQNKIKSLKNIYTHLINKARSFPTLRFPFNSLQLIRFRISILVEAKTNHRHYPGTP